MTMKLTIKNEDTHRTAVVITNDGGDPKASTKELAPGESTEVWLHSTRSVTVEEKPAEQT